MDRAALALRSLSKSWEEDTSIAAVVASHRRFDHWKRVIKNISIIAEMDSAIALHASKILGTGFGHRAGINAFEGRVHLISRYETFVQTHKSAICHVQSV